MSSIITLCGNKIKRKREKNEFALCSQNCETKTVEIIDSIIGLCYNRNRKYAEPRNCEITKEEGDIQMSGEFGQYVNAKRKGRGPGGDDILLRDLAPILSFTAEEIWGSVPNDLKGSEKTVFALQEIDTSSYELSPEECEAWEKLNSVRGCMTRAIEPLRTSKSIGHALDTKVTLYLSKDLEQTITNLHTDLRAYSIVSELELKPLEEAPDEAFRDPDLEGCAIVVEKARGEKCERCWIYSTECGSDAEHPGLCPRCTKVMQES